MIHNFSEKVNRTAPFTMMGSLQRTIRRSIVPKLSVMTHSQFRYIGGDHHMKGAYNLLYVVSLLTTATSFHIISICLLSMRLTSMFKFVTQFEEWSIFPSTCIRGTTGKFYILQKISTTKLLLSSICGVLGLWEHIGGYLNFRCLKEHQQ